MNFGLIVLFLIAGYLTGSISNALLIGKVFYKTDLRKHGSGNLGGTNAGRVLGKKAGFAVITLDVLKSAVPMAILQKLPLGDYAYAYAILFGIMVPFGHCFPLFAKFKGGKAVASSWGFVWGSVFYNLAYYPWVLLLPLLGLFLVVKFSKYVSLGSISTFWLSIVGGLIIKLPGYVLLCYCILWMLIIVRHKTNIERLSNGTESKIKW